jgi:hypothetical protein
MDYYDIIGYINPTHETVFNNVQYMHIYNYSIINYNDIIIINSCHLPFNTEVKDKINTINEKNRTSYKYIEINNNKWIDSGKWFHVLTEMNLQLDLYDFITFTNDSFEIYNPIYYFFNLASYHNADLFAYTSSSEIRYHYQTYLFIVKSSGIPMFIDFIKNFMEQNSNANGYDIEISIINLFVYIQDRNFNILHFPSPTFSFLSDSIMSIPKTFPTESSLSDRSTKK